MIKHKVGRRRANALSKTGFDTTFGVRECSICVGLWVDFVPFVIILIGRWASRAHANGLKSPEMARGTMSTRICRDAPITRMTPRNAVDPANEIGGFMRRLRAENQTVSSGEIAAIVIATDRPILVRSTNASPAEKWQPIRQFDRMLKPLRAANAMPQGSLIVIHVPRRATIDRKRASQAQAGAEATVYGCHPDPRGRTI